MSYNTGIKMTRIRVVLILLTFLTLGLSIASSVEYNARDAAERAKYFQDQENSRARGEMTFSGPYCYPDRHPTRLISITMLIGIALGFLIHFEKPIWSIFPSIGALLIFPIWYLGTREALRLAETTSLSGLDLYFYKASGFDLAVGLLLSATVALQFIFLILSLQSRFPTGKLP